MRKDDVSLNEAYSQVYNEGIWDRLKGQASGIGAGLKQGVQNVAGKIAGATGADVKTSGKTMGGSYANAQQTSLLNSFVQKAQKELNDFVNDMSKMGASSIQDVQKTHPQIAQQMQEVNDVIEYLKQSAAGQKPQGGGINPTPSAPVAPAAPVAPTSSTETPKEEPKGLEASTPSGTGPLTVQKPKTIATQQQATGVVQGIPHGVQRNAATNTNTSFSMATPQPKQVNQLPNQKPVQKAPTVSGAVQQQGVQDAEIVGGEESQKQSPTSQYVNNSEGQKTLGSSNTTKQPEVDDTFKGPKGITYTFQPTKNGDGWVDQNGRYNSAMQRTLTLGWQKQQANKK